jgi:hypothetical protein
VDGNYSVKTGYQAIMDWNKDKERDVPSTSNTQEDIWQKIWALNVPLSTVTYYGESSSKLCQLRIIFLRKESDVTLCALDVIIRWKLYTTLSLTVNGQNKCGLALA